MFVRLFCRAYAAREVAQLPFWSRLALAYTTALCEAGVPMRLISLSTAFFGPKEPWGRHRDLFQSVCPDDYVSVVCDQPGPAGRCWTAGHPNIALVAVQHVEPRMPYELYRHFDALVAPSEAARDGLIEASRRHGAFEAPGWDENELRLRCGIAAPGDPSAVLRELQVGVDRWRAAPAPPPEDAAGAAAAAAFFETHGKTQPPHDAKLVKED